jgi:serine protease Do
MWVAGTAPGSPASKAGILPGDIVTSLIGLPIATDGTMKVYCDVISTAGDHPISAEILRFGTQEVLCGEIDGEIPLSQVFSFTEEIEDESGPVADGSGATYSASQTLVDDTGQMTVDVPVNWFDVDTVREMEHLFSSGNAPSKVWWRN